MNHEQRMGVPASFATTIDRRLDRRSASSTQCASVIERRRSVAPWSARLTLAAACAALVACGPRAPERSEAEYCAVGDVPSMPGPSTRDLAVGDGAGATFTPWVDGGGATLESGFQGGYMLTPTLRVAGAPGDGDSLCLRVRIQHTDPEGPLPSLLADRAFTRDGDAFYAQDLSDLLAFSRDELAGHEVHFAFSAWDESIAAATELTLVLE